MKFQHFFLASLVLGAGLVFTGCMNRNSLNSMPLESEDQVIDQLEDTQQTVQQVEDADVAIDETVDSIDTAFENMDGSELEEETDLSQDLNL